jgi:hypothetical protein
MYNNIEIRKLNPLDISVYSVDINCKLSLLQKLLISQLLKKNSPYSVEYKGPLSCTPLVPSLIQLNPIRTPSLTPNHK